MFVLGFIVMRLMGRRGRREVTPFEFFLMIAMGSAAGDPMFHPDALLLRGVMVLAGILILHQIIVKISLRSSRMEKYLKGTEVRIVEDGMILTDAIHSRSFSQSEILMQLRLQEIENLGEVRLAYVEVNGEISCFLFSKRGKGKVCRLLRQTWLQRIFIVKVIQ